MLQLQLSVRQSDTDPDVLFIDDLTPAYHATSAPGGYGLPNLTRAAIDQVIFYLTTPGGRTYHTPPIVWNSGTYPLRADTFEADEVVYEGRYAPDCHDNTHLRTFADGQYDLSYEVYATEGIANQTGNFHLGIPPLYGNQQVWVIKNGVWLNITPAGALNASGMWEWSVFDTNDLYSQYEVRQYSTLGGYDACRTGVVEYVFTPSPTAKTRSSATPEVITAVTSRILLTGRVDRRLALACKRLLTATERGLSGPRRVDNTDKLMPLYTTRELLNDLKQSGETGSQAVGEALTDILQRVSYLESLAQNYAPYIV